MGAVGQSEHWLILCCKQKRGGGGKGPCGKEGLLPAEWRTDFLKASGHVWLGPYIASWSEKAIVPCLNSPLESDFCRSRSSWQKGVLVWVEGRWLENRRLIVRTIFYEGHT